MHNKIEKANEIVLNTSLPIKMRMRALFYLRNEDSKDAIDAILNVFQDKSVLLKHEAAYVLGQMINTHSIPALLQILQNEAEDEIVRHEAAEALGNFITSQGNQKNEIIAVLKDYSQHTIKPISESCFLALKKYEEFENGSSVDIRADISPFLSRDPAFPLKNVDFDEASRIFISDPCLYKRYQAMFYLRNLNTKEAVDILGKGFKDESSLFKHEIAFVFGQMRNVHSIKYLQNALSDSSLHGMVRHEAAEALGAIGNQECFDILNLYLLDPIDVVRESVEVALDIHEYENSLESEYAMI